MSKHRGRLRTDLTPVILHTSLLPKGGGLARAVPERASLYARHFDRVLVLTTGFAPRLDAVMAELRDRGTLDRRVTVRNFFRDSSWVANLGVPPAEALDAEPGVVSEAQRLPGRPAFRVADRRTGERHPFRYRYFDRAGQPVLTTQSSPGKGHELQAGSPDDETLDQAWGPVVAAWVDEEIAGLRRPVVFSLQRGLIDPVLLATTEAWRKVASLHNCHYRDPRKPASGLRPTFRAVLALGAVDEVVCLTEQQERELAAEVPHVLLRAIPYPGRPPRQAPEPKDPHLVVMVTALQERKRVDHAVRAFATVVRSVPDARLEIYGRGGDAPALQQLIAELGLERSVTLMGYSLAAPAATGRAACTLLTSTFEGFARVISESMSHGTPVVAYDVRYGPHDLIRDGVDGVLVTRHEPDALAEAVVGLLSDPVRAARMGVRASEVLERFPVADFERSWLAVLNPRRVPLRVVAARLRIRLGRVRRRLGGAPAVRGRAATAPAPLLHAGP